MLSRYGRYGVRDALGHIELGMLTTRASSLDRFNAILLQLTISLLMERYNKQQKTGRVTDKHIKIVEKTFQKLDLTHKIPRTTDDLTNLILAEH